jgi:DNA primase
MESRSIIDFYTEIVLPRLQERLDRAFPEFAWKPDRNGWVATNEEHTHSRLGVRAERVVAHGPAPRGFYVHGGEAMLWTAYVNGGVTPRGPDFVRAVRELGERAGVDLAPLEEPQPHNRRAALLHEFFQLCQEELLSERGVKARAYLEGRGFPAEAIERSGLGLVPAASWSRTALARAGFDVDEIATAGVFADTRWSGRLCGAWRDAHGRVGTLWARTLSNTSTADARYLYLRGASRTSLPPYGLSDVLAAGPEARRDLVLVEGVMDVHQLRARGVQGVAAVGGLGIQPRAFERLVRLGVERVTLCFDRDDAGRTGTIRAVEQAARADQSPAVDVLDPDLLAPAKDPDVFVRRRGATAWRELLDQRECGIAWRANELIADLTPDSDQPARRAALARAGAWLGGLPPRLALEVEDAIWAVAERSGYSPEAVERAFHARFWPETRRERGADRKVWNSAELAR